MSQIHTDAFPFIVLSKAIKSGRDRKLKSIKVKQKFKKGFLEKSVLNMFVTSCPRAYFGRYFLILIKSIGSKDSTQKLP